MKLKYKSSEKDLIRWREWYYQNREKAMRVKKEYQKTHQEQKKESDKKRRLLPDWKKKHNTHTYSNNHHRPILIEKIGCCEVCGSEDKLEIHHKRYSRRLGDCQLLCQPCHKEIHRKKINLNKGGNEDDAIVKKIVVKIF